MITIDFNDVQSNDPLKIADHTELEITDLQTDDESDSSSSDPSFFICCVLIFIVIIIIVVVTLYKYNQKGQNKNLPPPSPNYQQQSQPGKWLDYQRTTYPNQTQTKTSQSPVRQQTYPSTPETSNDSQEDYQIIYDEMSKKPETKNKPVQFEKEQKFVEPEFVPEPTNPEETLTFEEPIIEWDIPGKPEDLTESDLNKLRMKNEDLNDQLYSLESEKAMGKISSDEFNARKREIIKIVLDQYHK